MELTTSFKLLDIDPGVSEAQAKHAYKAQVRRWHPDQFPEGSLAKAGAEEQLKQINVAYARVKAHLASIRPDPAGHAAPSDPPRSTVRRKDAPGEKSEKRSWVDHLFSTLNAFAGHDEASPRQAPADETQPHRRKTFGQVLDEMSGGGMSAKRKRQSGRPTPPPRRTIAGHRHCRRRASAMGTVGGAESAGPVKPVSRVRGIGRNR